MEKEKLPWRSFNDVGKGGIGPIATAWNLQGTPTLVLLDHKGVIRHRWVGSPGEKTLDEAINRLVKEAGAEGKKRSR
jgi:hypothetical protein